MARTKLENSELMSSMLDHQLDARVRIDSYLLDDLAIPVPPQFLDKRLNPSQTVTFRELAIGQLVLGACRGESRACTEMFDRLMGKPSQYVENRSVSTTYVQFMDACEEPTSSLGAVVEDSPRILPPGFDEDGDYNDLLRDLGIQPED